MKSRWFQKMILSYLPLFFIVVSVLVFIFFLAVNQVAEEENNRANEQFAKHIMQSVDNELGSVQDTLLSNVFFSDKVQLFFNPLFAEDTGLNYELSQILQSFASSNSLVDSIYVYRLSDQMVLSNSIFVQADEYADSSFIYAEQKAEREAGWSSARSFKETKHSSGRTVISKWYPYPLGKEERGGLMLNISVPALQSFFMGIGQIDFSNIYVQDTAGNWLFGNVLAADMNSSKVNASLQSHYTSWTIYSGLNETYLFSSLRLISGIWIASGLLIIVAGLFWLFYVMRKNYKPIEALTARIEGYSLKKSMQLRGSYDEFKFIEHALDKLLEESLAHSKQLDESRVIKGKLLFKELLDGLQPASVAEAKEILQQKGFEQEGAQCSVVLVEMDRYPLFEKGFSRNDQNLLKFSLKTVVEELAQNYKLIIWAEWISDKHLAFVVNRWKSESVQDQEQLLLRYLDELLEWVETNLAFTLTIAIGEEIENLEQLHLSYDLAAHLLHMKVSLGTNRWLDKAALESAAKAGYYQFISVIHKISDHFKLGKEAWQDEFAGMVECINGLIMPRKEVVNLVEYLLHHMNQELRDAVPAELALWEESLGQRLADKIASFDTAQELFYEIKKELMVVFAQLVAWRKDSGNEAMIKQAQQYIRNRLDDANLSLAQISDEFDIPPSRFSIAFKNGVGEKFVDYVTRIRIEQAKKLLIETDASVQDICLHVGYIHAVSFNRAFKKLVQMTPTEYRKEQE
jgi:two-component system response regulator YesN